MDVVISFLGRGTVFHRGIDASDKSSSASPIGTSIILVPRTPIDEATRSSQITARGSSSSEVWEGPRPSSEWMRKGRENVFGVLDGGDGVSELSSLGVGVNSGVSISMTRHRILSSRRSRSWQSMLWMFSAPRSNSDGPVSGKISGTGPRKAPGRQTIPC